ncbi:AMP-binding protein [Vibrio cholerae]|nr:hypothetical protein [Vibrio cholerae]ELY5193022.1 AMP-binding protein [Vibrio cholerae]
MTMNHSSTQLPLAKSIAFAISEHTHQVFAEFNGETYTYGELALHIRQIAHALSALPAEQDVLFVCVQNPILHCAALFYSALSGKPYVPVDKGLPPKRIHLMLSSLQERATVLVDDATKALFDQPFESRVVNIEQLTEAAPSLEYSDTIKPNDLQYIIFTSGSTGVPKGAAVYTESFANTVDWYLSLLTPTVGDKCFIVSSLSFDLTQKNIFVTVLSGSTIRFMDDLLFDPIQISESLQHNHYTWINCAPSAFSMIAEHTKATELSSVDRFVLGGESINAPQLRKLREEGLTSSVVNSYGPTECADVAFYHTVTHRDLELGQIPIGRPIAQVEYTIESGSASDGKGELILIGKCVGAGYVNNESACRKSFLTITDESGSSQRAYRTGDIVFENEDGTIQFVNRADDQIKIRGNRIELGEVESAIKHCPLVKDAIIKFIDNQLIAFVVPEEKNWGDEALLNAQIRSHAAISLPAYAVPSQYQFLIEFPLNNSGKIDRTQLSLEQGDTTFSVQEQVATYTEFSHLLLESIVNVIAPETTHDTDVREFRAILDSLQIITFTNILNQISEQKISIKDVMLSRNFDSLLSDLEFATDIKAVRLGSNSDDLQDGQKRLEYRGGYIEILHAQAPKEKATHSSVNKVDVDALHVAPVINPTCRGIYIDCVTENKSTAYNLPLVLEFSDQSHLQDLLERFVDLVNAKEILRSCIDLTESGLCYRLRPTLTLEHLRDDTALFYETRDTELMNSLTQAFDLHNDYLFRLVCSKDEKQDGGRLMFVFHHLITDGLSLSLIREYLCEKRGKLPAMSQTLSEYSDIMNQAFTFSDTAYQMIASQLIKSDHVGAPTGSWTEKQQVLHLEAAQAGTIKRICREQHITPTAWFLAITLYCYSKQFKRNHFNFVFPNANRFSEEAQNAIGCFVNSSLVPFSPPKLDTLSALARYVNDEIVLTILEHSNLPLSRLLSESGADTAFLYTSVNHNRKVHHDNDIGELYNPRPRAQCGIEVQEFDDAFQLLLNGSLDENHCQFFKFLEQTILATCQEDDLTIALGDECGSESANIEKGAEPRRLVNNDIKKRFLRICNDMLGLQLDWLDESYSQRSMYEFGLDSLKAIQFTQKVNDEFSIVYGVGQLLKDRTFSGVYNRIGHLAQQGTLASISQFGGVRPYPSQEHLIARDATIPGAYQNLISIPMLSTTPCSPAVINRNFYDFVQAHPELFIGNPERSEQVLSSFKVVHNDEEYDHQNDERLEAKIVSIIELPFDIEHDLLLRVYTFTLKDGRILLYSLFHHAVWDGGAAELFLSFVQQCLMDKDVDALRRPPLQTTFKQSQASKDYYAGYFHQYQERNPSVELRPARLFPERKGKTIAHTVTTEFEYAELEKRCREEGYSFSSLCAYEMWKLSQEVGFAGFSNMVDKRHVYNAKDKMAYLVEPLPFFTDRDLTLDEFIELNYGHFTHLNCSAAQLQELAKSTNVLSALNEAMEVRFYFQIHWKDIEVEGKHWEPSSVERSLPWHVVNSGLSLYINVDNNTLWFECRYNETFVENEAISRALEAFSRRLSHWVEAKSPVYSSGQHNG